MVSILQSPHPQVLCDIYLFLVHRSAVKILKGGIGVRCSSSHVQHSAYHGKGTRQVVIEENNQLIKKKHQQLSHKTDLT